MHYIKRFDQISMDDIATVGGKCASLGEMYCSLSGLGVLVPNGYAITTDAYRHYMRSNGLDEVIGAELGDLDPTDREALYDAGGKIRASIVHGEMPADLREQIVAAYGELGREYGHEKPDVAVRSSATAEDLPTASFAGQQDTYLNIAGTRNLISTCKWVFASLFTERAIAYRHQQGISHTDVALSVAVQKMVRSDLASSGVMFTLDTESGFRDAVFITAAYGLGENVVQGTVNPDEFYVFKPTLREGFRPIIKRQLGSKEIKMIYAAEHLAGIHTKNVPVHPEDRDRFAISDDDVLVLARYAMAIEDHYSQRHGRTTPMDIEWAKDGESGRIYVVQARPETAQSQTDVKVREYYRLQEPGEPITTGKSVGRQIANGVARVILEAMDMNDLQDGEVLVSDFTDPDWEPVLKRAAGVVTNRGGRTCHAAIVARELGIPAIIGAGDATIKIHDGQDLTLSCAEGDTGYVYDGKLRYERFRVDLAGLRPSRTGLMLNLSNPEQAFDASFLPADGVGLIRLDHITHRAIGVHPRALLDYPKLDRELRGAIDPIIAGYPSPREFYVQRLAESVATIAAAFHPRPVIMRMSDFTSHDYARLIGGEPYEPLETNPALGFRGAARYFSEDFAECFAMECEAFVRVREIKGLTNLALAIPRVRTPREGERLLEQMATHGIKRQGAGGAPLYLMADLPTHALQAEQFLARFDGFVIELAELQQLLLGMDTANPRMSRSEVDDPALRAMVEMTVACCRRMGRFVSVCADLVVDDSGMTEFLVRGGIGSLSLDPDHLLQMKSRVADAEQTVGGE